MANDQFEAFIEAVAADRSLQEKLNSVADADAVVTIAKEAGFVISAEAVENVLNDEQLEADDEELSLEQLEAVSGGMGWGGWWAEILRRKYGTRPVRPR